jgi:hypothetical protein
VPDDRFADLGPRERDEPSQPSAAERLAELDSRDQRPRPDVRSVQRRYTWVVGVAAVIVIAIVSLKTLPNAGVATRGPRVGGPLPRFAAPSALGTLNADANVKQDAHDTGAPNRTPACDVRGPGVVNVCALERHALAITFIGPGTSECESYVDRLARLAYPSVTPVVVVSGRPRSEAAALVRRRRWTFPVAVDRNFAVEQLYRVSVDFCASTTFASPGGVVRANAIPAQRLSDAALRARLRALAAAR